MTKKTMKNLAVSVATIAAAIAAPCAWASPVCDVIASFPATLAAGGRESHGQDVRWNLLAKNLLRWFDENGDQACAFASGAPDQVLVIPEDQIATPGTGYGPVTCRLRILGDYDEALLAVCRGGTDEFMILKSR